MPRPRTVPLLSSGGRTNKIDDVRCASTANLSIASVYSLDTAPLVARRTNKFPFIFQSNWNSCYSFGALRSDARKVGGKMDERRQRIIKYSVKCVAVNIQDTKLALEIHSIRSRPEPDYPQYRSLLCKCSAWWMQKRNPFPFECRQILINANNVSFSLHKINNVHIGRMLRRIHLPKWDFHCFLHFGHLHSLCVKCRLRCAATHSIR